MFEFLILISLIGVFTAIGLVRSERKRRQQAMENWKQFEKEHPKREK